MIIGVDGEKGCEYGHMNREKIKEVRDDLNKIGDKVDNYSKMISRVQWLLIGSLVTLAFNLGTTVIKLLVKAG